MKPYWLVVLGALVLTGCSTLPETLKGRMDQPVTEYPVVAKMTEAQRGEEVRLGGMIVGVNNRESDSVVEIVALPISDAGRPDIKASSSGVLKPFLMGLWSLLIMPKGGRLPFSATLTHASKVWSMRTPMITQCLR